VQFQQLDSIGFIVNNNAIQTHNGTVKNAV
jgi:hypothetical protein